MLFVNAVLKISAKSSCRFVSATGAFNGALGVAFLLVQIAVAPAALGTTPETTTATMTSLSISAAGSMATSVASGTVVTLTAKVTAGGKVVSPGQVDFCDAEAKYCEDIHLLATVQLTKAGVAVYKFRPGIGSHTYKAEFRGTKGDAASASGAMALTVTGRLTTVTGLTEAGFPGEYSLIASVAGVVNKPGYATPSGKVSFVDTSSANRVLASMSLGSSESSLGFFVMSNPAAGFEANSIATADFNGDGIPDLVVTNSATYNSPDVINILIGVGNGTFTEAPSVATSAQFRGTAVVGDFNGDGIPDIAVTNNGDVDVSILLGNGDGTFKAAPNVITNSASSGIVVGDFNHDGIADLAILTSSGIQIFLGKGDGTFKAVASPVPVTGIPIWIVVGDFNRDGNEDLAVTNDSSVSVYLGDGNGVFKAVPGTPNEVPSAQGLAIGDFNGDGIPDLAAVNYGVYQGNAVAVMIGNGDGTFKAPKYYPAGDILDPLQAVVTDLNGDGIADLVVASAYSGYEAILLGNGDGTFTPAGIATGGYQGSGSVAIADFNGDGIPDLGVPDPNPESTVSILLTQPTRTVSVTVSGINPAGPGTQEVIASYPGDGLFKASVSTPVALTPAVNTPVISPASGTYTTVQKVTIAESTPGATIYYSVSGTTFTDGFVEYTGPFFLPYGGFEQVSAYATETGAQHSDYTTTTYNLNFTAAPKPVFSPAAGSYKVAQTVTITDAAPNAVIYYTTNGSYPTLASTVYAGPVTVSTSQLVSAVAIAPGYSVSDEAGAQYLIGSSKARFVYTVAGTQSVGYSGDGGPATFASLEGPSTVARDANGNLYIADSYTVRKIAAGSGIISTVAGDGLPGYSGDGAAATKAKLGDIGGLAVDGAGDLYISDETYDVVRRVAPGTGTITTIAGNGKSGDSGDESGVSSAGGDGGRQGGKSLHRHDWLHPKGCRRNRHNHDLCRNRSSGL